jgi:hypothetical protein
MTDEGSLQGEAPLLTPPGSSCADPSSGPIGRSRNARLSTGYGATFSRKGRKGRKGRRGARQAPISVLHRAISKHWAPFSATFRAAARDSSRTAETLPSCGRTEHRGAMTDKGSLQVKRCCSRRRALPESSRRRGPPPSSGPIGRSKNALWGPLLPQGEKGVAPGADALPFARRRPPWRRSYPVTENCQRSTNSD